MKCILFTSVLSGGGAERVLCQLANKLNENHRVILVAAYPSDNEYEVASEVTKIYLDKTVEKKQSFRQIVLLRKLIKVERPDFCISFLPQPNFKMILAAIGCKCKVIVSVRNDPNKEYRNSIDKMLAKVLYSFADGVVFQTTDAQNWFPKRIVEKSEVIMNQVNPVFFCTNVQSPDYYVATGRLNAQKNYPLMISAFARFIKLYPNEKLRIYGVGEKRDELVALIHAFKADKNIELMGASDNIPYVLANAKGFILSSNFEGMPNGLLEAMAVGIPCIATDCPAGGPRSIIKNNHNGILVPVDDEEALLKALVRIEMEPGLGKALAEAAKMSALAFEPRRVFDHWTKYINSVLRK